jgi:hypothetical protein
VHPGGAPMTLDAHNDDVARKRTSRGWYDVKAPNPRLEPLQMIIRVFDDGNSLAGAAASQAAAAIRTAIALRGRARIVAATGASQLRSLRR